MKHYPSGALKFQSFGVDMGHSPTLPDFQKGPRPSVLVPELSSREAYRAPVINVVLHTGNTGAWPAGNTTAIV